MSSKAIKDAPSAPRTPRGAEVSPSVLRNDDATFARYVGFLGVGLVFFGGIFLIAILGFSKGALIGPFWATILLALGLICLLYHAAFDRDIQFRRAYMAFSYAAIAVGVGLSLYPYPHKVGDQFPAGFLCLSAALAFLLAFLRNEDEQGVREVGQWVLLGVGGALLAVGLIGGNLSGEFLLGTGLLSSLLGLLYITAFLGMRGVSDDLAYYIGLGLGGVAVVVFVIALVRSAFYPGASGSYIIPGGLLLMTLAFLAGMVSLGFCSDARIVVLTRRELGAFFYTPLAYFVLLAFTMTAWFCYFFWLAQMEEAGRPIPEPIVFSYVWGITPVIVLIVSVPALTMRLFSEERRTGTLEVMLTAPLGEPTVVMSKFFAALFMFLLVWVPFGLFLVALRIFGGKPFDYRPMLAFAVVLVCTGANFTSFGLFCSSITRNQLVSGVLCFVYMVGSTIILFLRGPIRNKSILSIVDHTAYLMLWQNALNGKLPVPELLFHISLAVLFLFVTVKVLEARKWL